MALNLVVIESDLGLSLWLPLVVEFSLMLPNILASSSFDKDLSPGLVLAFMTGAETEAETNEGR